MKTNRDSWTTGIVTILTASLVILGQIGLVLFFDFPRVFDQPMSAVLDSYHRRGGAVSLAWFTFALGTLMMIPLAILYDRLLHEVRTSALRIGTVLGIVAGFAYAMGISRWVLLAKMLSAKLADPAISGQAKETIVLVFQAFDVYCGNSFGETVAPLAHGGWALLLGITLRQARILPSWVAWAQMVGGILIALRPLEYLGWKSIAEISDAGTLLWTLLLLGMGIALLRNRRVPEPCPSQPA
jgi:Domain of unknown function (DUF4386)